MHRPTYPPPKVNKPWEAKESVKRMVGTYVLIDKPPKYDPNSNVPFINNKAYNELLSEKVHKEGTKFFVAGTDGLVAGAAVLNNKTAFNAFLHDEKSPVMVMSVGGTSFDAFAHENFHLKQRREGTMARIDAVFDNLARSLKAEKIPQGAQNALVQTSTALLEAPACIEQLKFMGIPTFLWVAQGA